MRMCGVGRDWQLLMLLSTALVWQERQGGWLKWDEVAL